MREAIFVINMQEQQYRSLNKYVYTGFVYYTKAFENMLKLHVKHEVLVTIFNDLNLGQQDINVIVKSLSGNRKHMKV